MDVSNEIGSALLPMGKVRETKTLPLSTSVGGEVDFGEMEESCSGVWVEVVLSLGDDNYPL